MPDVNTQIRNLLLKRSHYVYLFENGTIRKMVAPYHRAKRELMARVAKLEDFGQGYTVQYRLDRLNSMIGEIDNVLKFATMDSINSLSYDLNQFAENEKTYIERLLGSKFNTIGISINRIPIEQVSQIVNTPIGGELYHERMKARYGEGLREVKKELTQSIIQGEDMARASRRLFGLGEKLGIDSVLGKRLVSQPAIIARTEIMRVSNETSRRVYEANADIIKGLQFVATLDNRTCRVCGSRDGMVYPLDKEIPWDVKPPLHSYCRCVMVPITKSWAELEEEAGIRRSIPLEEVPAGTRASFSGQVPDTMTYDEWLRQQEKEDSAFVHDILGPKFHGMWNAGKMEFREMVKGNRILTLEELGLKSGLESYGEFEEGGVGSGFHGHAGRPGLIGGSMLGGGKAVGTKIADGNRMNVDGTPLPDYIQSLKVPPAWTLVVYNDDPNGDLLVKGKDAKGRDQYIYSERFKATQAEAKFNRVKELNEKFDRIYQQNEGNRASKDPIVRENADCLKLIMETGIRPGSDVDTKAKVKAYGATTLEGRHVVAVSDGVELRFTGKKGVNLKIPVTNRETASNLLNRAKMAGPDGKLFRIDRDSLSDYTHGMDGGGFKTKDFRTHLGTYTAQKEVKGKGKPKTMKEYKKMVKEVATVVARKLGNTPTIALQSYINPTVFSEWRVGL